jgi:hypothetical protein
MRFRDQLPPCEPIFFDCRIHEGHRLAFGPPGATGARMTILLVRKLAYCPRLAALVLQVVPLPSDPASRPDALYVGSREGRRRAMHQECSGNPGSTGSPRRTNPLRPSLVVLHRAVSVLAFTYPQPRDGDARFPPGEAIRGPSIIDRPRPRANGSNRPFSVAQLRIRNGSSCEGFRTTAHFGSAGRHRGRRPKASREGTRGELRYGMCRALWRFDRGAAGGRSRHGREDFVVVGAGSGDRVGMSRAEARFRRSA